jgi:hypothetical protein
MICMKRLRRIAWNGMAAVAATVFLLTAAVCVYCNAASQIIGTAHDFEQINLSLRLTCGKQSLEFDARPTVLEQIGSGWMKFNVHFPGFFAIYSGMGNDFDFVCGSAYWIPLAPSGIILLLWIVSRVRGKRPRGSYCSSCGYDLRATPDRCPECGCTTEAKPAQQNS